MNSYPERNQRRGAFRDSLKAAVITGLVMGTLWVLVLKVPAFFGNNETIGEVCFFALLFPGAIIAFPSMLANGHNFWSGWMVIGAILNWLLYSCLVYAIIHFRRRKREAGLPPLEPQHFSYTDRWQRPPSRSSDE